MICKYSQILRRQVFLACCNQLVTCIYLEDRRLGALGQGNGNWDNTVCTVHLQDYVIYLQWRITFTVRYSAECLVPCTRRVWWYRTACCTLKKYYSREKWFFGELRMRWQMEAPVIGYWQGREFFCVTLAPESFTALYWHLRVSQHHIGTWEFYNVT